MTCERSRFRHDLTRGGTLPKLDEAVSGRPGMLDRGRWGWPPAGTTTMTTVAAADAARPAARSRSAPSAPTRRPRRVPDGPGGPGAPARLHRRSSPTRTRRADAGAELIPGLAEALPEPSRTAARPTSSSCARASSTATGPRSRPATSRTRSSACSCSAARCRPSSPAIEGTEEFAEKGDMNGDIPGIETDDADRRDHDHPHAAGRQVPVRARRAVRGAHAGGEVARQEPDEEPAARARARTRST